MALFAKSFPSFLFPSVLPQSIHERKGWVPVVWVLEMFCIQDLHLFGEADLLYAEDTREAALWQRDRHLMSPWAHTPAPTVRRAEGFPWLMCATASWGCVGEGCGLAPAARRPELPSDMARRKQTATHTCPPTQRNQQLQKYMTLKTRTRAKRRKRLSLFLFLAFLTSTVKKSRTKIAAWKQRAGFTSCGALLTQIELHAYCFHHACYHAPATHHPPEIPQLFLTLHLSIPLTLKRKKGSKVIFKGAFQSPWKVQL